jgi:hypothetical protein
MSSKTFLSAIAADVPGAILTRAWFPGLLPLPWLQTLAIFAYALVSCLIINDALKVWMIKWTAQMQGVSEPGGTRNSRYLPYSGRLAAAGKMMPRTNGHCVKNKNELSEKTFLG